MAIATGEQALASEVLAAIAATILYGDGSDGDTTISGNTSLSRDMYYNSLTVNEGVTLTTNGYRIFVENTLTNNGIIDNSGGNGGNGSSGIEGSAGAAAGGGSVGASGAGVAGKVQANTASGGSGGGGGIIFIACRTLVNNGTIRANGGNAGNPYNGTDYTQGTGVGNSASTLANALGAAGGAGGNATGNAGNPAGGTSAVTAPAASETGFRSSPFLTILRLPSSGAQVKPGNGGGSGAVSVALGAPQQSAVGGSGGGGGGVVILCTSVATYGTVQANGGSKSDGIAYGGGTAGNGSVGSAGTIIEITNV